MIIRCPHCQAKLKLPETVEGKRVRCPACKEVIHVTAEIMEGAIKPAPAVAPPPPPLPIDKPPSRSRPRVDEEDEDEDNVPPRPRRRIEEEENEEDEPSPRRRRSYDEDEDDDADFESESTRRERTLKAARRFVRLPAIVMIATFFFTSMNVVVNSITGHLAQADGPNNNNPAYMIGVVCGIVILGTLLIFIGLAGLSLLRLRWWGLVITGVVMNFIFLIILGLGLAANVALIASKLVPVPMHLVLPTVILNSISCVLNLGGAILSIRALINKDVNAAFTQMAAPRGRRRRR